MDADARLDAAVGSVAEEAAKLLEAFGRSQARPRRDADPAGSDGTPDPGASGPPGGDGSGEPGPRSDPGADHVHVAMGDAETCSWCPVCRSVTLLRGVSPETLGRLADLATAAATVLADLATRHTEATGAPPRAQRPATSDRTPRTEPITVVDEEDVL